MLISKKFSHSIRKYSISLDFLNGRQYNTCDNAMREKAMVSKEKVLVSRTIAVPADTNPWGDIFGGWIMSLMDIAAGTIAARLARGSIATKAIKDVTFDAPIFVGDEVSVYSELEKIGNTSLTLNITVNIKRKGQSEEIPAVKGIFVMVALNEHGRPRPVREKWTEVELQEECSC